MSPKNIGRAAVLACILTSGCASFQANNLPEISRDANRIKASEKTRVYSRWETESSRSIPAEIAVASVNQYSFEMAILDSGCCTIVESATQADLIVDGVAVDHTNPAVIIPALITGLSLFIIPSWATDTVDIKVTATADDRSEYYELDDSVTVVQWLPMAFAFPFTGGPVKNVKQLRENTYRTLVSRLKDDQLL